MPNLVSAVVVSKAITAGGGEEAFSALAKVDSLVKEDVPDERRISGHFVRADGASVPDRPEMPDPGFSSIRPVFSSLRQRRRRIRDLPFDFRGSGGSGGRGGRGGGC